MKVSRRSAIFALTPVVALGVQAPRVAVMRVPDYGPKLGDALRRGAAATGLNLRGKRVLVKPNLVEFDSKTAINTDARFVAAVVDLALSQGAAEVRIGEGPGHRRDTWGLAEEAGYFEAIPKFERIFVDLNRDEVSPVEGFLPGGKLYAPVTALRADVILSLAKMKTHHWAGVTLSMKNLFGLVPGSVYGWPKNPLHYVGIDRSIVELNRIFARTFAIVDGVIAMEGNGPIQGSPKHVGAVVMSADPVASDATCARIMGIAPERVGHLRAARKSNELAEEKIEQVCEPWRSIGQRFELAPGFERRTMSGLTGELRSISKA